MSSRNVDKSALTTNVEGDALTEQFERSMELGVSSYELIIPTVLTYKGSSTDIDWRGVS
jgi:hypothetical protein